MNFITREECETTCGRMLGEVGENHAHVDAMGERVASLNTLVRESLIERLEVLTAEFRSGFREVRHAIEDLSARVALREKASDAGELARAKRSLSAIEKIGLGLLLAGGGAAVEIVVRRIFGG